MPVHLMVQIYEEAGVYVYKDGTFQPGLTKSQVMQTTPGIVINEEQSKLIDETGWFKLDYHEKTDHVIARAKVAANLFKEMAKGEHKDKTVFATTHSYFQHCLVYILMDLADPIVKYDYTFCPHNNSLTIVDFDVIQTETYTTVKPRLMAHNLQLIENQLFSSQHDFI